MFNRKNIIQLTIDDQEMKSVQKVADKVLILGTTQSWKEAPLGDSTWEVWGMNQFWDYWGAYATRWFEIHPMSIILKHGWNKYSWMSTCTIPIYMLKHYARIPTSISYPLADVANGFLKQFSSTFCYELALAVHEGFKTIGIYGVDFSGGTLRERFVEWRGVLYWLGVATGRGIKIQFPNREDEKLAHRYLYGLEYWKEAYDVRQQIREPFNLSLTSIIDGLGFNWNNYKQNNRKKK